MIIPWNMNTFLNEGSPPQQNIFLFSISPTGAMKKNKYTPNPPVLKALFFFCTECGRVFCQRFLRIKSYSFPHISINDCIHKNQPPYLPQIYQIYRENLWFLNNFQYMSDKRHKKSPPYMIRKGLYLMLFLSTGTGLPMAVSVQRK